MSRAWRLHLPMCQWWAITAFNSLRGCEAPDWRHFKSYWASKSLFTTVLGLHGKGLAGGWIQRWLLWEGASPVSNRASSSHEMFSADFSSSQHLQCRDLWTICNQREINPFKHGFSDAFVLSILLMTWSAPSKTNCSFLMLRRIPAEDVYIAGVYKWSGTSLYLQFGCSPTDSVWNRRFPGALSSSYKMRITCKEYCL